jgi:hypothetical protein
MKRRILLSLALLTVGAWAWQGDLLGPTACEAAQQYRAAGDLFYNYYVPPAGANCQGAQMYPCPMPAPPRVGYTYITYQPLMPHEFMYKHYRSYRRYHADGSVTRTRVSWR